MWNVEWLTQLGAASSLPAIKVTGEVLELPLTLDGRQHNRIIVGRLQTRFQPCHARQPGFSLCSLRSHAFHRPLKRAGARKASRWR